MILKRKVKAGVLLYALLMAAIFTLLLQFYLGRVRASHIQQLAQEEASKAYLIATIVKDQKDANLTVEGAQVTVESKNERLDVTVTLSSKGRYHYTFHTTPKTDVSSSSQSSTNVSYSLTHEETIPSTSVTELKTDQDTPDSQKS
ncbi:competence type IV pilus minor pilin ComGG [Streptococcus hyointestinalis]|uniref:competence type IV pilus minor pilin ComGG n=1 Tax=Streptococcus hyointestinalis TaxID=1337 RepID=UPI003D0858DF